MSVSSLLPSERIKAIEILVNSHTHGQARHEEVMGILRFGFKGYGAFSDDELIAHIQKVASKTGSWEANQFINEIANDILLK